MKKTVRITVFLLSIVMICMCFSGCSKHDEQITNLLAEFEYSCNTLDVEAMLNCISPSTADKIKFAIGIFGMISDKNTSEVLDDISASLIGDSSLDGNDFFSSIKIDVNDIEVDEDEAVVSAYVEYKINGETYNKIAEFKCVYYMEQWYISKFSFV